MAQLSDSEPHEVNTISLGSAAPIRLATCSRDVFNGALHLATERVRRRRIAEELAEIRLHRVEHFRRDARGGVVIEVNHLVSKNLLNQMVTRSTTAARVAGSCHFGNCR